ncbi:MAG: ABC transporter permease [Bacteroidetes bacterium]|nr:ABC transporter permease [Bacteroidota bacterium]
MFRNYITIAFRNLLRNKVNTSINLIGLALGISCCLLITLFVQDELQYDQYHEHKDVIYRVSNIMRMGTNQDHYALTGMAVGPGLTEAYPEIDTFVRFRFSSNRVSVKYQDRLFNERLIYMVDPNVFDLFSYTLIKGNKKTALSKPGVVVLTQSLATKYFGDQDPIGKVIELNNNDFEVTGVMEDLPSNSDLPVNALTSMLDLSEQARQTFMWDWGRLGFYTFLKTKQPINPDDFKEKLEQFSQERVIPFWRENSIDGEMHYELTPLPELHFRTDMSYDTPKGNQSYLYIFSMVALFILLIACINYINLSVAQSTRRSTEVGIRKASGAERSHLISQFMGESMILALTALALAIIVVEVSLPVFNNLAGKSFSFTALFHPEILMAMLGIVIVVGIVAGSYPAFYLSSFNPVDVLKGTLRLSGKNWLRKSLVVVQFTISVIMIIATLIVYEQMDYLKNRDLGFNKDQVMVVEVPGDTSIFRRFSQVKYELLTHPGVKDVATTGRSVPGEGSGSLLFRTEQANGDLKENHYNVVSVDEKFMEVMNINLLEGRNFERSRTTDPQQAFMVNRAFVKAMGWENPVGKRMQWGLMANNQAANDGHVVGVFEDYHYTSLHNEIDPLVWIYNPNSPGRMLIDLKGGDIRASVSFVEEKWKTFDPGHPMEYFFLDAFFDSQYQQEEKMMQIFGYFSILTILIACMGLFGVASFVTQQRTKEVGIRKTLGAENSQIVYLLSRDFAVLVIIAILIAAPVSWFGMSNWLSDFAYPTDMPVYAFGLAGMVSFAIALLTTGYHSLKAARSNPVHSLRHE